MPKLIGIIILTALIIKIWYIAIPLIIIIVILAFKFGDDNTQTEVIQNQNNTNSLKTYNYDNKTYDSNNNSVKNLVFHPKSETFEIFGKQISNAMFYTTDSNTDLPFAINKNKAPNLAGGNCPEPGYWPNYNNLTSTQKGNYIKWLVEGKCTKNIDLGYVYIYYYGLEYRALIKKKDSKEVLFEIIDLVSKYPSLRYGFDLIAYLIFQISDFSETENQKLITFFENNSQHYQYNSCYSALIKKLYRENYHEKLEFAPYQFLSNNEYLNLSNRKIELLNFYVSKVINKFEKDELYAEKQQKYSYHMAMGYFYNSNNEIICNSIVPSAKLKRYWRKGKRSLENLKIMIKKFDSSTAPLSELEKYVYLPIELRNDVDLFDKAISFDDTAIKTISELVDKLGFKNQEKFTLRQSEFIAETYHAFGYNVEPDPRIDKKAYKENSLVSIYKMLDDKPLSVNYNLAALFLDLGYKIALEDKELLDAETTYIDQFITKEFALTSEERLRLEKRAELITFTKENNANDTIKKLLKLLDNDSLDTISKFLISVAISDGIVKPSELNILKKIFKQLDLSEEYLNNLLSKLIDTSDEPIVIKQAETKRKKGSKIPLQQKEEVQLVLDPSKLSNIMTDTSKIQRTLQKIFEDKEREAQKEEPQEIIESTIEINNNLQGIINTLTNKKSWSKNELMNIIQNTGLMLSSALDQINEWSNENYGDFLIEESDNLYLINEDVVDLMKK